MERIIFWGGIDGETAMKYLAVVLKKMKLYMMPDYFSKEKRIEIGGLYGITLNDTSIDDIYRRVKDRDDFVFPIEDEAGSRNKRIEKYYEVFVVADIERRMNDTLTVYKEQLDQ